MLHQLIHLTDPHLTSPGRRLYALDPLERLISAVHAIKAHHLDADAIFITGDLTHWGEPAAYAALKKALEPLPVPYYLVVGNHDSRAAFHAAFPEVPTDDGGFVQYVVPLPEAKGIVLDSLVDGAGHGALCEERLAWLERTLAELKGEDVFLFMHHAPFRVGVPSMDRSRLHEGAARLAELALAHGRVRHLFHGHLHRPMSGSWHGIPCSTVPATAHQVFLDLWEPDTVYGTHEPPALGVVLWNADTVVMHQENYLDASPRFSLSDKTAEAAQSVGELVRPKRSP